MTTRAQVLREEARQALYRTPNDQECEVPIMVATLRKLNDIFDEEGYGGDEPCCCVFRDIVDIIDELETLDELAQENPQGPLDAL